MDRSQVFRTRGRRLSHGPPARRKPAGKKRPGALGAFFALFAEGWRRRGEEGGGRVLKNDWGRAVAKRGIPRAQLLSGFANQSMPPNLLKNGPGNSRGHELAH